jgi:hypothetical protein
MQYGVAGGAGDVRGQAGGDMHAEAECGARPVSLASLLINYLLLAPSQIIRHYKILESQKISSLTKFIG